MEPIKHKHHIVPRYMGGSDEPMNLIELSIEEHAEAHKELWEYCGHWQDYVAWKTLSGQMTQTEAIRQSQILAATGRSLPPESRKKTSESVKKLWSDPEYRKNQVEKRLGKLHTDEQKAKIKATCLKNAAWKGKKLSEQHKANLRAGHAKRKLLKEYENGKL